MAERSVETAADWSGADARPLGTETRLRRIAHSSALRASMLLVLLRPQTSIVRLAAISAVMLIVTRNFDLSVGSAVALVGVILALLTIKADFGAVIGVTAAI